MKQDIEIKIFVAGTCPYCEMAKELLENQGYTFEVIDLTNDPQGRMALVERTGGQKTVPQIFMNGRHMGGYEDLRLHVQDGTL